MAITGQRIRRERLRRKLTQHELATNAGVSLRTIGRIERDELEDPRSLELVAAELGLTTTGNALTVIDRYVGYTDEGYRIDQVARDDAGRKIRVRVLYSVTVSYAVADVLAADLTWTNLASESPSNWHDDIPDHDWTGDFGRAMRLESLPAEQHENGPAIVAALQEVADRLLDRAAAILA